jgi:hypothetical protein
MLKVFIGSLLKKLEKGSIKLGTFAEKSRMFCLYSKSLSLKRQKPEKC